MPAIADVLNDWRHMRRLGVRAAAKEIGISPTTYCRIERGENADPGTMRTLIGWLFFSDAVPSVGCNSDD